MTHQRRWFVPVLWYLSVALGAPFVNGAHANPSFYTHAACVLATVAGVTALALIARHLRTARGKFTSISPRDRIQRT